MTTGTASSTAFDISAVQAAMKKYGIGAWLFYYFHENDPIALRVLRLDQEHFYSRRWVYIVPASGQPMKVVHRIEPDVLESLPGEKTVYLGWREFEKSLQDSLSGLDDIAMQYSPNNAVPYVSRVDCGMIELIRSFGTKVVSSADLVQEFEAVWSEDQLRSHIKAAEHLREIITQSFAEIGRLIRSNHNLNEYDIQQFIMNQYDARGMVTSSPPIVAVNGHAGKPHYQPTKESHAPINKGDLVLLDIWAKLKEPHDAVYADITWTGFTDSSVPSEHANVFDIVRGARDAALAFVDKSMKEHKQIRGAEVDDVCRDYIRDRNYGDYFIHRTGHSIGVEVHANGANIDNLETRDERLLIPRTCFSIEPGIYLDSFGIRSEIDCYLAEAEACVYGQPIQTAIVPILA